MLNRRASLLSVLSLLSTTAGTAGLAARAHAEPDMQGTLSQKKISSKRNGTTYPLNIYLPPGSTDGRRLAVVYLLDGESRFQTLVDIAQQTDTRTAIVGIGNEDRRSHDYVPANTCTEDGGGEAAYFDFIRFELIPFIESSFACDPARRVLMGHSHGGAFALYAMFNEAPGAHHFGAYLAADPSLRCMPAAVRGWDAAYAARNTALPARCYVSYANRANEPFIETIEAHRYSGLTLASKWYPGGHNGMVEAGFTDALRFAFAPWPSFG
jgi:enterochelin esterase-like enzyme